MSPSAEEALKVIGKIEHAEIAIGQYILETGGLKGSRLTVADPSRLPWSTGSPTPLGERERKPYLCDTDESVASRFEQSRDEKTDETISTSSRSIYESFTDLRALFDLRLLFGV